MASDNEVLITSASFIIQSIASISLMYQQQSEPHEPVARVSCAACTGFVGPSTFERATTRARARARVVWTQLNYEMSLMEYMKLNLALWQRNIIELHLLASPCHLYAP